MKIKKLPISIVCGTVHEDPLMHISNVPTGSTVSLTSFSETTLHPIHRSIGVSRSASSEEGGCVKASFTPSNSPYNSVLHRAVLVVCAGRTEKAETAAVVDAKTIAVEVPFIVEIKCFNVVRNWSIYVVCGNAVKYMMSNLLIGFECFRQEYRHNSAEICVG